MSALQQMLVALGPGGTTELAERALAHARTGVRPAYDTLGGLAEVAELVDRKRPAVSNWIATPKLLTPPPVFALKATPVWDLKAWRDWGRAHPDLMGPGFDPFAE